MPPVSKFKNSKDNYSDNITKITSTIRVYEIQKLQWKYGEKARIERIKKLGKKGKRLIKPTLSYMQKEAER